MLGALIGTVVFALIVIGLIMNFKNKQVILRVYFGQI